MAREQIASDLVALAQEIAERRYINKIAIESLSDQMLPEISHEGHAAIVQDAVEGWAYTWLDYLQGGIDRQPIPDETIKALRNVPLENYFKK